MGGTAVAAVAVAARVAWRKSEGKGKDLEDEMGKRFACHAASALVVSARRQIGGPLAAYNSARAAPMRFGAHRVTHPLTRAGFERLARRRETTDVVSCGT